MDDSDVVTADSAADEGQERRAHDDRLSPLAAAVKDAVDRTGLPFRAQIGQGRRLVVWDEALSLPFIVSVFKDNLGVDRVGVTFEPPGPSARELARAAARSAGSVDVRRQGNGTLEVKRWSPYRVPDALTDVGPPATWVSRTLTDLHQGLMEAVGPQRTDRKPTSGEVAEEASAEQHDLDVVATQPQSYRFDAWVASPEEPPATALAIRPALESPKPPDTAPARTVDTDDYREQVESALLSASAAVLREQDSSARGQVEVLQPLAALAPGLHRLQERLADAQLRAGLVTEAGERLAHVPFDELTPTGAATLVEAAFRSRRVPQPIESLARVDWTAGQVLEQLFGTKLWMPFDIQVAMARILADPDIADVRPPRYEEWLTGLGLRAPVSDLPEVFTLIRQIGDDLGTDQLLEWIADRNLDPTRTWVREHLELYGLESDDLRVVRRSFEALVEVVRRTGDLQLATNLWSAIIKRLGTDGYGEGEAIARAAQPHVRNPKIEELVRRILTESVAHQKASTGRVQPSLRSVADAFLSRAAGDCASLVDLLADPVEVPPEPTVVTTVVDAVLLARARYPHLAILDEALDSARKRGPRQARKTWEVLQDLGGICASYQDDPNFDVDAALAMVNGFRSDVSETAKTAFRGDYLRSLPDGRSILLGPHIPTGPDGRVYFQIDRMNRGIIVGHVGRHLRGKSA